MQPDLPDDIWNDLLVLHLAGEASGETRRLVEERLARDPAFAAAAERAREGDREARVEPSLLAASQAPAAQLERRALAATKRWLRLRQTLFGLALASLLIPFSFVADGRGIQYFALRDAPAAALPLLAASSFLWLAWFWVGHRTKATGL